MIKQGLYLRIKLLKIYGITALLGLAAGCIPSVGNVITSKTDGYAVSGIGTFIMTIILLGVYFFWGSLDFVTRYNEYVGFSMTRRVYYIQEIITSLLLAVIIGFTILTSYGLEFFLIKILIRHSVPIEMLVLPKKLFFLILLWIILGSAARLLVGGLMVKLGEKIGFWVVWAIWMLGCWAPSCLADIMRHVPEGKLQAFIHQAAEAALHMPMVYGCLAAILAFVLICAGCWFLIRKKEVA